MSYGASKPICSIEMMKLNLKLNTTISGATKASNYPFQENSVTITREREYFYSDLVYSLFCHICKII